MDNMWTESRCNLSGGSSVPESQSNSMKKHSIVGNGLPLLAAILLTSCTSESPLLDESRNSTYVAMPTRWSTADAKYPREVRLKEKTLKYIDEFWSKFKQQESQLTLALENLRGESGGANRDMLTNFMKDNLSYVDPAITYEFGPLPGQPGHKLDFSTDGHEEIKQIVDVLVAKAPKLPKWKFCAHKQPVPLDTVAGAFKRRAGIDVLPFETQVDISASNRLDVTFTSPDFSKDEADNAKVCSILTDLILGEDNSDNWLGVINAKQGALGGPFNVAANAKLYADLFNAKKKALIASLPAVPYFKTADLGKPEVLHFHTVRPTMNTPLKKIGETLGSGKNFQSEQFSKLGEKFVYLKLAKSKDLVPAEKHEPIGKELDATLRKANFGCVIGTGSDTKDSVYFDMCLANVDKAIPELKKFCQAHNFSHESTLRFYDADLLHEWVGMYEDTSEPKDMAKPWFLARTED
ncbi:MAG: hypothetical protein C0507_11135 [Cyanobacteria bacterium PR.3.49]|nr:hypothetical protein [Cyanobacteria bacterium PR.3.49]